MLDVMLPACAPVCGQTSTQTPCSVLKRTRMGTHPLRARTTVRQTPYFSTGWGKQVAARQHSGGTCPPSSFLSHELSEPGGGHRETADRGWAPAAFTLASRGPVGRGRVRRLPGGPELLGAHRRRLQDEAARLVGVRSPGLGPSQLSPLQPPPIQGFLKQSRGDWLQKEDPKPTRCWVLDR